MAFKEKKISTRDISTVKEFLISNQGFIKDEAKYFDELRDALNEFTPKTLKDDLDSEYKREIVLFICEMISRDTGIDTETIMIAIEDINLKEYLK